jgi:preprotein translocase subunit YajC
MKKLILNLVLIFVVWLFVLPAQAQKDSRDLYLSKSEPGVKITLVLNRKGKIKNVARRTVFQAGDKVAFKFSTNFSAYVAVLTKGSSGKRKLLFPYKGAQDQMTANEGFRVPSGQQWFEFDNTPGKEELVFIMSSKPITELSQFQENASSNPPPAPTQTQPAAPAKPPTTAPAPQANAGKTEEVRLETDVI